MSSFAVWVAGWLLMIGFLVLISRTTPGSKVAYYVLWLLVILLLVTHQDAIASVFQQANILQGQS